MEAFQLATQLPGVFSPRKWTFAFLAWCLGVFFWGGGLAQGEPGFKGSRAALHSLLLQHHGCKERATTWSFVSQNSAVLGISKFTRMEGAPG